MSSRRRTKAYVVLMRTWLLMTVDTVRAQAGAAKVAAHSMLVTSDDATSLNGVKMIYRLAQKLEKSGFCYYYEHPVLSARPTLPGMPHLKSVYSIPCTNPFRLLHHISGPTIFFD